MTLLSLSAANPDLIELHHDGVQVLVMVRRSDRSKRIRLRVTDEGAEVVLPRRSARRLAEEAVRTHAAWLVRHVGRLTVPTHAGPETESKVMFRGKWRTILNRPGGRASVSDNGDCLTVTGRQPELVLEKWLKRHAEDQFFNVLKKRSCEMGLVPTRVSLRDQKTKWGACTSKGTVTFNWRLIMAPYEVLDYVVVHELAHLKELNHSIRYWKIVEIYCPDHKVHRKWLRENGRYLKLPTAPALDDEPSLD